MMKPVRLLLPFAAAIFFFNGSSSCYAGTPSTPPRPAIKTSQSSDLDMVNEAIAQMRLMGYEQGRQFLNRLSGYDSPLNAIERLLIADSYYREGGSLNLSRAESEYHNWLKEYPDHKFTPIVRLKMAECVLRMLPLARMERPHAAETMLLELQAKFPQSKEDARVLEYLSVVQEMLGDHELRIAKFYFELRNSLAATSLRCRNIVEKRPLYSRMDVVLWYLGICEEAEENTDEAIDCYERIARKYPNSEFHDSAVEKLKSFGRLAPGPEPDADEQLLERLAKARAALADIKSYCATIPQRGVLLDETDQIDPSLISEIQNDLRMDEMRRIVGAISFTALLSFL